MSKRDRIQSLQQIMMEGGKTVFETAPMVIINIIKHRAWEGRLDEHGKEFTSFEALINAPLWHGLETSIEELRAICRKNDEALQAIDRIIPAAAEQEIGLGKPGPGRGHKTDSDTTRLDRGATYALRRLKRDRPDLAERVIAGGLSANAAAIEAGFRKKPVRCCPKCGHTW